MGIDKDSRYLSYLLRHNPQNANLNMDKHGWVSVQELINNTNGKFSFLYLEQIVKEDKKQRYSFSEDKTKIKANQGHSIHIDLGLHPIKPPDILYHGTAERFIDKIEKDGVKKMTRDYVHLSKDLETAISVGKRHGKPCIIVIDAKRMYEEGNEFFLSDNKVWLTNYVSPKYFLRKEKM